MRYLLSILLFSMLAIFSTACPAGAVSSEEILAAEVSGLLVEGSPWDGSDGVKVEVTELDLSGYDVAKSAFFDDVTVTLPRGMRSAGKVTFSVGLMEDGAEVDRFWASARLSVYTDAVVALVPLRRDSPIAPGDVRIDRVEAMSAMSAATSLDEVVGMVARRPINPGMVVRKSFLKPRTLVRRGEPVVIRLESERLRIKYRATALENGAEGGIITVKTGGGKEVQGKVVGPGELLVRF